MVTVNLTRTSDMFGNGTLIDIDENKPFKEVMKEIYDNLAKIGSDSFNDNSSGELIPYVAVFHTSDKDGNFEVELYDDYRE